MIEWIVGPRAAEAPHVVVSLHPGGHLRNFNRTHAANAVFCPVLLAINSVNWLKMNQLSLETRSSRPNPLLTLKPNIDSHRDFLGHLLGFYIAFTSLDVFLRHPSMLISEAVELHEDEFSRYSARKKKRPEA